MKKLLTHVFLLGLAMVSFTAVAGDAAAGKAKSALCAGCHGADGNSPIATNPKLNGQHEKYLVKQLEDFTKAPGAGGRNAPMMAGMAAGLSAADRANLAAYFAAQKTQIVAAPAVSADDIAIGERIYRAGNIATGVPACIGCHGPQGKGNAPAGWPRLSGQHAAYVTAQLQAFRVAAQYPEDSSKGRRNDGDGKMMRDAAARLSDREIEAVSAYVQGLH
jgi:cytochrome c553